MFYDALLDGVVTQIICRPMALHFNTCSTVYNNALAFLLALGFFLLAIRLSTSGGKQ